MYKLKPFDRVLVRDSEYNVWDVDIFKREFIFNNRTMYETFLGRWYQCIPYEGNEHLYLTTSPSVMFSKKNKRPIKTNEEIKKLRKEYIVVARTFADDDEPSYSITKRDNFSVMPYHDTFGPYGEVDYTCDYTIEENDSCFDEFKSSVKNELRLDVERTCDGLSFTDPDTGEEVAITPAFELYIKMWRAKNQFVPEVYAWNYHDGNNWQSIILDGRELDIEPYYEEVDGETAEIILSQFDGSVNDKGGRYETEDYIFTSSMDQSDPWTVHVEEKQQ